MSELRCVFVVGDSLRRRDVDRLLERAPGVVCVNLYGATETQQSLSYYTTSRVADVRVSVRPDVLPLGSGIPGVQLLVLNRAQQLAGVGEIGEICFRSPYLAAGYLGDEQLTRQRFRCNPISGDPEDRIYATGDNGRYLPDGNVEFCGRRDFQVKIRGFRIELGEVESVLASHPGVRQSVVVIREDSRGEKRLAAYLLYREPRLAYDEIRQFVQERLPSYMVPSWFETVDSFTIMPNGKIDRQALPDLREQETCITEPQTGVERVIADVWSEVLGLSQVGRNSNFFDLGGHSLLLTKVHARLQSRLVRSFPLLDLFLSPTVRSLANRLADNGAMTVSTSNAEHGTRQRDAIMRLRGIREGGKASLEPGRS